MRFALIGIGSIVMVASFWFFGSTERDAVAASADAKATSVPFAHVFEALPNGLLRAVKKTRVGGTSFSKGSELARIDVSQYADGNLTVSADGETVVVHLDGNGHPEHAHHEEFSAREGVTTKESATQHERQLNGIDRLVVKTFHGDVVVVESDKDDRTVRIEEKRVIRGVNREAVIAFDGVIETRIRELERKDESEPRALLIEGWKPEGNMPKDLRGATISFRVIAPKQVRVVKASSGAGNIRVENGTYDALDLSTGHGDMLTDATVETVKASSGAGNVTVKNVSDTTEAATGHGDINLNESRGKASLKSGAGNITTNGGSYDALDLHTGHGDVKVQTTAGALAVKSGAGNVTIREAAGPGKVDTGHGDIVLVEGTGSALLKTGAGAIRVQKGSLELLEANTSHGDVEIDAATKVAKINAGAGAIRVTRNDGFLSIRTGHGDVRLIECAGNVSVDAGAGRITVEGGAFEMLGAKTGHGDVQFDGNASDLRLRSGSGQVRASITVGTKNADLDTGHGDMVVTVDPALPCDVDAATGHGQVNAQLSLDNLSTNREKSRVSGARHGGGTTIKARSGSGNVTIR
ncbi:MAG: DUF4097 family beta strand repeat-containing protein [Candidatus Poribacteria bacterium]|nr:DUF4097 family beta strand repeat-containing protein [Candidatus Poribacteria bacterium]